MNVRSPLIILHGRICGDYFRHISQKFSAIRKVLPQIFVSSDEIISRSSPRAELLEVPVKEIGLFIGSESGIAAAYAPSVREKLEEELQMQAKCIPTDAFKNGEVSPEDTKNVSYVFSTWNMSALTEDEIDLYFPSLRAVFYAAGTVRYFARPYLKKGIAVFSAWGANAVPVAEVTVSEIILANKGFFQTLHNGKTGEWHEHEEGKPYPGNFNTRVGIIGAGMIGSLVIEMLKNYRLQVSVFDPFLSDERACVLGVEKVTSLPQLFASCQVISNHLANNPQTVNMIDRECFSRMKPNGVFINTGRGQQVVEADLIEALRDEPNRVAVLDVTYPEPPEKGSPLYTMDNVYLTPHMAGSIGNEIQRMGEYMLEEYLSFKDGKPVRFSVTEKMLETMA